MIMRSRRQHRARGLRRVLGSLLATGLVAGGLVVAGFGLLAGPVYAAKGSPPSPPTAVRADVHDHQVTVSWTPPAPGPLPLTGYLVTELNSGKTRQVKPVSPGRLPSGCTFSNLPYDVPVRFAVRARNAAGLSAASEPSEAVSPHPELLLSTPTLTEGRLGPGGVLAVTLTDTRPYPVTARLRSVAEDGGARPGEDFAPLDVTVTIPAGALSVDVPLTVLDDDETEPDEYVGLELTSTDPPTDLRTSLRIVDDEAHPRAVLTGPAQVAEGDAGSTDLGLTLQLSRPLAEPATLSLVARVSDARTGKPVPTLVHLTAAAVPVVVPAGVVRVPIPLAVRGDVAVEHDVRVEAVLSGAIPGMPEVGAQGVVVGVRDDDTVRPSGADLALSASPAGTPAADGVDDVKLGRSASWTLSVRQVSRQPVAPDAVLLVSVTSGTGAVALPAACSAEAPVSTDDDVVRTWSCPLTALRGAGSGAGSDAGSDAGTATVPVTITGAMPGRVLDAEAVVAWPGLDDPRTANNAVRARLRIVGPQ